MFLWELPQYVTLLGLEGISGEPLMLPPAGHQVAVNPAHNRSIRFCDDLPLAELGVGPLPKRAFMRHADPRPAPGVGGGVMSGLLNC